MAGKSAILTLTGDGLRFESVVPSGHTIVIDDGEGDTGARPTELLVTALGACTAMDVISILRKKRQPVIGYEVRVTSEQRDAHPYSFLRFDLVHVIDGAGVDVEAVRRAVELSATKYCAVGATLSTGSPTIHHAYLVRDPGGEERYAEVVVTGPHTEPGSLAR